MFVIGDEIPYRIAVQIFYAVYGKGPPLKPNLWWNIISTAILPSRWMVSIPALIRTSHEAPVFVEQIRQGASSPFCIQSI